MRYVNRPRCVGAKAETTMPQGFILVGLRQPWRVGAHSAAWHGQRVFEAPPTSTLQAAPLVSVLRTSTPLLITPAKSALGATPNDQFAPVVHNPFLAPVQRLVLVCA